MVQPEPSYDARIKALLLRDVQGLGAWLLGRRPTAAQPIDPGLADTQTRYADKLLLLTFPEGNRILLHVEFQTHADRRMGRRMLVYAGMIAQLMDHPVFNDCEFRQVVVYLDPEQDPEDTGEFVLPGGGELRTSVQYRIVRAWEEDPGALIASGSPWLLPIGPLTRVGDRDRAVVEFRERIRTCGLSSEDRANLLSALGAFSGIVIRDAAHLKRLIGGIDMGESVFIREWVERGRAEGL
ncbi:MAG: hypothetical protein JXP34_22965, partial [Planctomycetes bacterium]|nr:hypothetical protein [Planctomycetota bacterium]